MAAQCKEPSRKVNILVAQDVMPDSCSFALQIMDRLHGRPSIATRSLTFHRQTGKWIVRDEQRQSTKTICDELVEWADLLIVTCLKAGSMGKMLQGDTDGFLLEVLRSWDVSKKILLMPGMTFSMWENPMTKKQINKIRRKWNWIQILEPILWHGKDNPSNAYQDWLVMEELIQGVQNQADLISLGHDDMMPGSLQQLIIHPHPEESKLPSELWSLIMEYVGDWEVAKSLGIYTNLPLPVEWRAHHAKTLSTHAELQATSDLESTVLLGNYTKVVAWFNHNPTPKWLSKLCVKLIIKFARTSLLSYLELNHKDLFWSTFGHTLLPTKASAVFGRIEILDWWNTSPSFLTKEYNVEALDSASKAGYIRILEWWRTSGLPLKYTEAALEQASSRGNIEVLEWWRNASLPQSDPDGDENDESGLTRPSLDGDLSDAPRSKATRATITNHSLPLRLKAGKSIIYAAQNGKAATLHWWINSGIPTAHEEPVARIASANGHVKVLQLWKDSKGGKMQYDNQVLVGPTKNGHVDVLEWWKQSGYTVEYKTCDIEEALEDSLGGSGEDRIRAWWARNGLNLGVGTSEWMKIKVL